MLTAKPGNRCSFGREPAHLVSRAANDLILVESPGLTGSRSKRSGLDRVRSTTASQTKKTIRFVSHATSRPLCTRSRILSALRCHCGTQARKRGCHGRLSFYHPPARNGLKGSLARRKGCAIACSGTCAHVHIFEAQGGMICISTFPLRLAFYGAPLQIGPPIKHKDRPCTARCRSRRGRRRRSPVPQSSMRSCISWCGCRLPRRPAATSSPPPCWVYVCGAGTRGASHIRRRTVKSVVQLGGDTSCLHLLDRHPIPC